MLVMEEVNGVVDFDIPTADLHAEEEEQAEVKRELRDFPPAHYLFKIQNFSLFSDAKIDNYESNDFEVGGYKWKLSLHPEGNKKVNEKGHISLYLVLSKSNSLALHQEVNVSFKLFAYNQIKDKYLAVQDAKERVWRFRGTITEWGFDQFIPLNVFKDASNGYLIDDCCIFGAEIFVLERTSKGECATIAKKLVNNTVKTYTWNIENYGQRSGKSYKSPDFAIGGFTWTLSLYSNGDGKESYKSLSIYLGLLDLQALYPGERLHVKFIMRIRDEIQGRDLERLANYQFTASSSSWGSGDIMPLSNLIEPSQGYINANGTMIVEVQILLLTVVKDFS